jgi:ketosteroid isomerase-like protein
MSQENVERLRAIYEAFNASKQIDLELLTPDVEFTQPEIGESVYHGREGVARGVQELFDVFEDIRAEPEEFFVAGSEVVVFVRLSGRARGSGVPVEFPLAHVFRFRGAQVDRWHA